MTNNKETKELKPCPFCGGEAEYQWQEAGTISPCQNDLVDIYCTSSGCEASISLTGKEPGEAIKAWNTRTNTDLQTKLDSSNAKIKMLTEAMDNIIAHQQVVGGTASGLSVTANIARQALASTDTERYKLEQAVIDAAKIVHSTFPNGMIEMAKALAALQEHNNAGEES